MLRCTYVAVTYYVRLTTLLWNGPLSNSDGDLKVACRKIYVCIWIDCKDRTLLEWFISTSFLYKIIIFFSRRIELSLYLRRNLNLYIPLYTQIKYSYTCNWPCLICLFLNHNDIYALWEKNGGTGSSPLKFQITSLE